MSVAERAAVVLLPIGEGVRERVARLQERYIAAVDGKDMNGWLECFTAEGSYFVQGRDNAEEELPVCLMYDDSYERLADRVTFVTRIWPGAFEDYQTRHFLQPLSMGALAGGAEGRGGPLIRARTNVQVLSSDQRGQTRIFATGVYEDLIRIDPQRFPDDGESARFERRRLLLDTFATPGVVVYPL